MTREEIIKAIRVHRDQFANCDECPLNKAIGCVLILTKETIALLEKEVKENAYQEV